MIFIFGNERGCQQRRNQDYRGLITLIWDKWLELWKMRNEDVYARKRYGKQSCGGEKRSTTPIDGNLCNGESHGTYRPSLVMPRYSNTPGANNMGNPKLVDNVWKLIFQSKCKESDNLGNPRCPIHLQLLPPSVR
jgi:hypothetical protein